MFSKSEILPRKRKSRMLFFRDQQWGIRIAVGIAIGLLISKVDPALSSPNVVRSVRT